MPLTMAEAAQVLGAELAGSGDPHGVIGAVTADSRAVRPGALFVALPGERVDGHRHVAAALGAGAVGALTARPVDNALCLVVDDPLVALGALARALVDRAAVAGLQVVGITGSQGKTSTKDLLAQILEAAGPTIAPIGNLNNELGVPLTVSRIDPSTRFLVVEMGARGIGHIAYLCRIAPPRIGVVLNVGHAHVGEFGGQPAIAQAKGELVESLPADGFAVLNADDPLVWAMRSRTRARVLAFSDRADPGGPGVWASHLVSGPNGGYSFQLHQRREDGSEGQVEVELQLAGRHQVGNATAAAAVALALGLDLAPVAGALTSAGPRSRWRMEVRQRSDGVTVINDAYNANPDSMRAAVSTLAEFGRGGARRTWAVLGDMLELGESAVAEHRAIGREVAEQGIDALIAIGEHAEQLADGARSTGRPLLVQAFRTKAEAVPIVLAGLDPDAVVLVKASRGLALNTVADDIQAGVPTSDDSESAQ